jgi:aspartate-semialdehyde dehydrogenase
MEVRIMEKINVAVLGATGTVGQQFLNLLENHPMFSVAEVAASERSAGKKMDEVNWLVSAKLPEQYSELRIQSATDPLKSKIVFSALPPDAAEICEAKYAKDGLLVISKARTNRMVEDIPLLIPEVNPDHLALVHKQRKNRGYAGAIVTDPNCSTIGMAMGLKPIMDSVGIEEVVVTTMQALSGAGFPGVPSTEIMGNVLPLIKGEEEKMEKEPLKILGTLENGAVKSAKMKISASCTRVPVIDGHLESIYVKTKEDVDLEQIKKVMNDFKGLPQEMKLPSAPVHPLIVMDGEDRPQPKKDRMAGDGMSVCVGRLRPGNDAKSFCFFLLSHNTVRGAAGAGILDAELIVKQGDIL